MTFPALHRSDLLQAVMDKSNSWCVRYFAAVSLSQSKAEEIVDPLISVVLDRNAPPLVRAGAAIGLQTVVLRNQRVKDALTSVLYEPNVPSIVTAKVMVCLGQVGVDDLDLMLKIANSPVRSLNGLGTNFNAIRAIATSKNPKALDLLFALLDKYPPNSLLRGVVIDEWTAIADSNPRRFAPWRERLAEKLIPVSRQEIFGAGNLNSVIKLMGKTHSPIVVDRLIELMEDPSQDPVIVAFSAQALGIIGDRRALPHVKKLWNNLPNDTRGGNEFGRLLSAYKRGDKSDQNVWDIKEALDRLSK